MPNDDEPPHLILDLLQAFYWFDEGLQNYLRERGWPEITRPQSMLMANLALGHHRPSEIARRLGVSRQAVHSTLAQMVDKGVLALADDPHDKRIKVVELTALGETMRADARAAMRAMVAELTRRIGPRQLERISGLMLEAWGEPLTFAGEVAAPDAANPT